MTGTVLATMLDVAVPVAIEEVRDWDPRRRLVYASEHADVIASRGDDLIFGARKAGETGKLFATLARCLACLAFQPGGVEFNGRRWVAADA